MEMELLKKIEGINFKKVEKKVFYAVAGIFGTYFAVSLLNKFISDNYSFRIQKISNLPPVQPTTTGTTTLNN